MLELMARTRIITRYRRKYWTSCCCWRSSRGGLDSVMTLTTDSRNCTSCLDTAPTEDWMCCDKEAHMTGRSGDIQSRAQRVALTWAHAVPWSESLGKRYRDSPATTALKNAVMHVELQVRDAHWDSSVLGIVQQLANRSASL